MRGRRVGGRITLISLSVGLLVVLGLYLSLGRISIWFWDPLVDLAHPHRLLVYGVRLPRAMLALIVGGILGITGTTFQAILRNPLAEPFVVGVSGGAALGASLAIALGLGSLSISLPLGLSLGPVFLASFIGAAAVTGLLFVLSARRGQMNPAHLLLMGVVFNFFASSLIMVLKTVVTPTKAQEILFWLMGTLGHPPGGIIALIIPAFMLLGGLALLMGQAKGLNALSLGGRFAAQVGVSPDRLRMLGFLLSSALVAIAVSTSGFIGFVGLVVPHGLRLIVGPDHRILLPASALGGALFLLTADLLARMAFPVFGTQLPVGALTSLVGGPLFIWLLIRSQTRGN
jgi:cobalamin transport system permease protein